MIVIIEATSDMAIETEEIYGEHGESFKGELVKKKSVDKRLCTNFPWEMINK